MRKSLSLFLLLFIQTTAHARVTVAELLKVPGIVHAERLSPTQIAENQEKFESFSVIFKVGRREMTAHIAYPRHFYQRTPAIIFNSGDELLPSLLPEINADIFGGNGTRILIFTQTRGVEKDMLRLLKMTKKLPLIDKNHVVLAGWSRPSLTQLTCENLLRAEFDNWIWQRIMRGL